MKKALLIASLILLAASLGMEFYEIENTHLIAYGCLGTGVLGALYPAY